MRCATKASAMVTRRLVCLAIALILTGGSRMVRAADGKPLTLLAGFDVGYTAMYVADREGFFKDEGLEVTVRYSVSGKAAVDAEVAGAGVMAVSGALPAVTPAAAGAQIAVVAPVGFGAGNEQIVVAKGIEKAENLVGKRVGFQYGSQAHIIYLKFLAKHGIDPRSVTAVNVKAEGLAAAFARGDIQAVVVWEPHASKAQEATPGSHLLMSGKGLTRNSQVVTMRRDFLQADPASARKILQALLRATEFIKANPERAAQDTAVIGKLDPEQVKKLMPIFTYRMLIDDPFVQEMQDDADFLFEQGMVKRRVQAGDFIEWKILKEVAPQNVPANF